MLHHLQATMRAHPRTAVGGIILAATAAGLAGWAGARLVGLDLEVVRDGETSHVGIADVIAASVVAGLLAWAVHALLVRSNHTWWWPFVASTALAISINGPSWFAEGGDVAALIVMHFLVGIVLIWGFAVLSGNVCAPFGHRGLFRRRESSVAR